MSKAMPPVFRTDLLTRQVQEGNYTFVEFQGIRSPDGGPVRLYDFEFKLARAFDGRSLAAIASAAPRTLGLQVTIEQLAVFAQSLKEFGLLRVATAAPVPRGPEPASPRSAAGWGREASEPTSLMDNMDGLDELLAASSRSGSFPTEGALPTPQETAAASEETSTREGMPTFLSHPGRDAAAAADPHARDTSPTSTVPPGFVRSDKEITAPSDSTHKTSRATAKRVLASPDPNPEGVSAPVLSQPDLSEGVERRPGSGVPQSVPLGADSSAAERAFFDSGSQDMEVEAAIDLLEEGGEEGGEEDREDSIAQRSPESTSDEGAPAAPLLDPEVEQTQRLKPDILAPVVAAPAVDPGVGDADSRALERVLEDNSPDRPATPNGDVLESTEASAPNAVSVAENRQVRPEPPARGWVMWALLGGVVALAGGAAAWQRFVEAPPPQPLTVQTATANPVSVYRWFDTQGAVSTVPGLTLALETTGTLERIVEPGTAFETGDILAALNGSRRVLVRLGHHKERLVFYQQLHETMAAEGNLPEQRQAKLKIAEKQRLVTAGEEALAKVALVATRSGTVAEVLVQSGQEVEADQPLLRLAPGKKSAVFAFDGDALAVAQKLPFCRLKVDDRHLPCTFLESPDSSTESETDSNPQEQTQPLSVSIELGTSGDAQAEGGASLEPLADGTAVLLARARFDAVFALPKQAIVQREEGHPRVYVATDNGHAELRAVALADDTSADEVLVTQGLDVGDAVIVNPSPELRPGSPVIREASAKSSTGL